MIRSFISEGPWWILFVLLALSSIGYIAVGLVSWYVLMGLNYDLNGGQLGRHPYLFPFECFAEEFPCYWFGGKEHRINFMKSRIGDGNGAMLSSKRTYSFGEIREGNLYEEVFWAMCGGRLAFWLGHVSCFLFWPLFLGIVLFILVVSFVLLPIRWAGRMLLMPFRRLVHGPSTQ